MKGHNKPPLARHIHRGARIFARGASCPPLGPPGEKLLAPRERRLVQDNFVSLGRERCFVGLPGKHLASQLELGARIERNRERLDRDVRILLRPHRLQSSLHVEVLTHTYGWLVGLLLRESAGPHSKAHYAVPNFDHFDLSSYGPVCAGEQKSETGARLARTKHLWPGRSHFGGAKFVSKPLPPTLGTHKTESN